MCVEGGGGGGGGESGSWVKFSYETARRMLSW